MSPENEKDIVGARLKEAQQAVETQSAGAPTAQNQQSIQPVIPELPRPQAAVSGSSHTLSHLHPQSSASMPTSSALPPSAPAARQQPAVEDGHVSDADSDSVEEIPAAAQVPRPQAQMPAPMMTPPAGMPPGMDSEHMRNMMQNPGMMRQAAEMMRNMDPAQLQSMAKMAGAPGRSAIELVCMRCS